MYRGIEKVHNDKLYRGIANGHSPICSSFCLFLFLSFQIFSSKISPQPLKIETSYLVYRFTTTSCIVELKMGLLLFVLPFIFPFIPFSFFPDFSSKISPQPFKIDTSNLVYRFTTTSCIVESKMGLLLFVLSYVFSFSFSPDFLSKISPQPFKIETSNLVYRFTTTSCIVESKMGLLLFVLPFIGSFFFLSRFFVTDISTSFSPDFLSKISPQPFQIETSNLVYRFTMTSCIVETKMGLLLFVLPFICFFSFSPDFSSKISPQPFKIETSNWYRGSQRQVVL